MDKANKTIVVAELGQNWNGDFDLLIEMTDSAFNCGVDYTKLQLRTPRKCVPKNQWDKPGQWLDGSTLSYIEYRERLEITVEDLTRYDNYVKSKYGNRWFPSIWDLDSLTRATAFVVPYLKIPSALITNLDLVRAVKDTGIPAVFSTGMSTEDEVEKAAQIFPWDYDLTILYCNSTYPTPDEGVDLLGIGYLNQMCYTGNIESSGAGEAGRTKWKVGFSSHHISPYIPVYASILGAEMVEVHFTLSRAMWGSDQSASVEPPGLSLLCREIKRIPTLLGKPQIKLYESELSKRASLRGNLN